MKKFLTALTAFAVILSLAACGGNAAPSSQAAAGETYTATAQGYHGDFPVTVVIDGDRIVSVTVGDHEETPGLSDPAIEQIPAAIVEKQSVNVDAISGATITSDAIKKAVADAIKQAGLDPSNY